jgi:2-keto-3-deoxy-L-rhamnonate aldolase RhmA
VRAPLYDQLTSGIPVFALGIRNARSAEIVRMARTAGYGVVWIDLEHSTLTVDGAAAIASTAWDLGLEAWIRIPEQDLGVVGRLLDGGASGIIAPHVETAEEAQAVVRAARFAPRGCRSRIGLLPQTGYRRLPASELMQQADLVTSVHILLESHAGVQNAASIAAVDGVDLLHVGMNDLSTDLGRTGFPDHPEVIAACHHVIAAARQQGKAAVIGGVPSVGVLNELVRAGAASLLLAAIDTDILAAGLAQRVLEWTAKWPTNL